MNRSSYRSVRWIFDCGKWCPSRQEWATASTSVQREERERIGRFFFKRDAKNSMAGRLLMRKFLTLSSGRRWKDVEIRRAEHGKPYFVGAGSGSGTDTGAGINDDNHDDAAAAPALNFNVSHQGNYAVLAGEVGNVAVGVDVMTVDYRSGEALSEYLRLMRKQFSADEWLTLRRPELSERQVCRRFYRLWCLKESYLKATGSGLTESLMDISFVIRDEEVGGDRFTVSTEVVVGGQPLVDWCFHEVLVDDDTFVAVALSPRCQPLVDRFQFLTFDELISEAEEITPADDEYCDNFFRKQNLPNTR